jgi:phosphopantothenoylcysteine synthetase/decarboxylase
MKKLSICFAVLFSVFLLASVSAQAVRPFMVLHGPPLTEADIPIYKAVTDNTAAAGKNKKKLDSVYEDTAKQFNVTRDHVLYVYTKIARIQAIIARPESRKEITRGLEPDMIPSDEEIRLVRKNIDLLY